MSIRDNILTALVDDLKDLVNREAFDNPEIAEVKRFWPILDDLGDELFPLIVVDDNGSRPGPDYNGVARFTMVQNLNCIVRAQTDADMTADVEALASSVQKYLYSGPILHSQALDIKEIASEDLGAYSTASAKQANIMHQVRIIWYETVEDVDDPTGSDVYGVEWLDTARDKLVARLEVLKTTMASGYDPTFGNVYPRHTVPDLVLNAVSVGLDNVNQENFSASTNGASVQFYITFSVRVHTRYEDDEVDDQEVGRLVNSIVNHLRNKIDLEDNYRIFDIEEVDAIMTFDESETRGGQMMVTIGTTNRYTQE